MQSRRSVGHNLGALAVGEVLGLLITLVGTAYLARTLGSHEFGVIGFALAVLVYFSLVADWGLDVVAVRQVAGGKVPLGGYVTTITVAKMALASVAFVGLAALTLAFLPADTRTVMLLYGLGLFVQPFTINWVFQGTERLQIVAMATLLQRGAYVLALPLLIKGPRETVLVPVAAGGAAGLAALFLWGIFVRQAGWPRLGAISWSWLEPARMSTPNALSRMFRTASYNFDVLALGFLLKNSAMVGWYAAAYRLVMALIGGVGLYVTAIYPAFSRIASKGRADLASFLASCLRLTTAIVLPVAVGGTALAAPLMHVIYGPEYAPGVVPLKILLWEFGLVALIANLRYTLLALERLRTDAWIVGCGTGVNVLLNLWLIPRYDLVGAAIATLGSEILVAVLLTLAVSRALGPLPLAGIAVRPGFAAAAMGISVLILGNWTPAIVAAAGGVGIYALSLFTVRGTLFDDFRRIMAESTDG